MHDSKTVEYPGSTEELMEKSKALHDRIEETIRTREDQLRAAKATLNELRERLRRLA